MTTKTKIKYPITTQKEIRKAFWQNHPEHEAHALKWQIKTAPHNRHNTECRYDFCQFVGFLYNERAISNELANRATL